MGSCLLVSICLTLGQTSSDAALLLMRLPLSLFPSLPPTAGCL